MAIRVLAADDSPIIQKLVTISLTQAGFEVSTVGSGAEALRQLTQVKPEVVILDVSMPEMDGYQVCRQIRSNPATASLPVMIVTSKDTLEEKVAGYEAGADDYMIKPFEPAELQARVKALVRRAAPVAGEPVVASPSVKGKTIAVFSLRGGSGVSTVATNLATGLAQLWTCSTALVDLAWTTGHAAMMLNLSPHASWADLADRTVEEIDLDLLDQVLAHHGSGTRVLAAPRRLEHAERITPDKVARALDMLIARYPYVVVDMPHQFDDAALEALDRADEILLLVVPEVLAVVNAMTTLEVFDSLGYQKERIRLVLNRTFERQYLSQADIEGALKRPISILIPFASDALIPAINAGVPVVMSKPNVEIGMLFEDMAFNESREQQRSERPATPSPALVRTLNRMQRRKK